VTADFGRASRVFRFGAFAILLAGLGPFAHAAAPERSPDDIRGLWVDNRESDKHKVGVMIEDCDGALCGRIIWLKKPMAGGEVKRDLHNPDAALRERPLCGLKILTGFRPGKAPSWFSGYIYNPNDGRTFNSTIHMQDDGSIKVRGFVGVSLFGKTVEWVRPQERLDRCS